MLFGLKMGIGERGNTGLLVRHQRSGLILIRNTSVLGRNSCGFDKKRPSIFFWLLEGKK